MAGSATSGGVDKNSAQRAVADQILHALDVTVPAVEVPASYKVAVVFLAITLILIGTAFIALVAFMAWLVIWHLHGTFVSLGQGPYFIFHIPMAILGLILLTFLLKPIFLRPKADKEFVIQLKREEEPLLFDFVDKLCQVVGSKPPTIIEVDCDANASARLRKGVFSLFQRDLVLRIGLPLVAGFSVQQLSAVLAHEFGHFNQQQGMGWSYLIRRMNQFFARIVFQRDRLDAWLDYFRKQRGRKQYLIYLIAAALIEPTRGFLWLMLIVGDLLCRNVIRRMEYDADTVAAQIAGAKEFARMHLLVIFLDFAANQAKHDLSSAYQTRRLPDDLPRMTVAHARLLAPRKDEILKIIGQEKTHWYDTHPCHADRARNVDGIVGAVVCDKPAKALFRDFSGLCRRATDGHYRSHVGDRIKEIAIVPVMELVEQQSSQRDSIKQVRRFFQDQVLGTRPVFPAPEADSAPPDAMVAVRELTAARKQMLAMAPQMGDALEIHENATRQLVVAQAYEAMANIAANPNAVNRLRALARNENRRTMPLLASTRQKLDNFASLASVRLTRGLQLLMSNSVARRLDGDVAAAQDDAINTLRLCQLLQAAQPRIQESVETAFKANILYASFDAKNPFRPLEQRILGMLAGATESLRAAVLALGDEPYPFEHGTYGATCASHLVPMLPNQHEVNTVTEAAMAAYNRFGDLCMLVLAKLVAQAERVESMLKLDALPDPDDKAREAKARKQAQARERRGEWKYWLHYGLRAAAGIALMWFLVALSLNPPTLPAFGQRDQQTAYRPASFSWQAPGPIYQPPPRYQPTFPGLYDVGQPGYYQIGHPGYYEIGHPGYYEKGHPGYIPPPRVEPMQTWPPLVSPQPPITPHRNPDPPPAYTPPMPPKMGNGINVVPPRIVINPVRPPSTRSALNTADPGPLDRYTIPAPVGFKEEPDQPANSVQWSHQESGRAVKSSYSVTVRHVGPNYRVFIFGGDNPPTLTAGNITFKQTSITGTNIQKTARWAGVDGDCLIEITATWDTFDKTAVDAMNNAVKKIAPKPAGP